MVQKGRALCEQCVEHHFESLRPELTVGQHKHDRGAWPTYIHHETRSCTFEAVCKVDVMLGPFFGNADREIVRGNHALGLSDLMGEFHKACDKDPVSEPVDGEISINCRRATNQSALVRTMHGPVLVDLSEIGSGSDNPDFADFAQFFTHRYPQHVLLQLKAKNASADSDLALGLVLRTSCKGKVGPPY